jgi:hypothetical protein
MRPSVTHECSSPVAHPVSHPAVSPNLHGVAVALPPPTVGSGEVNADEVVVVVGVGATEVVGCAPPPPPHAATNTDANEARTRRERIEPLRMMSLRWNEPRPVGEPGGDFEDGSTEYQIGASSSNVGGAS